MGVRNVMEIIVWERIDRVLDGVPNICRCEKCRDDIAAFALNHLKPKYATTHKGEVISKAMSLEPQYYLDVITALTQGAEQVGRNPRHD
jgi:competence protein ComFB